MKTALFMALATTALFLSGCGKSNPATSPSTSADQAKSEPDTGTATDTKTNQPTLADDGTLVLPADERSRQGGRSRRELLRTLDEVKV